MLLFFFLIFAQMSIIYSLKKSELFHILNALHINDHLFLINIIKTSAITTYHLI